MATFSDSREGVPRSTSTPDASVIDSSRSSRRTDRIGTGRRTSRIAASASTMAADSSATTAPHERIDARRQPDSRKRWQRSLVHRAQHATAVGDDPRVRASAEKRDGHLWHDRHHERVRKCPVVARRRDDRNRREVPVAVGRVERHEARAREGLQRGADALGRSGRHASDLDPVDREERRHTRTDVEPGRRDEHRHDGDYRAP